MFEDSWAYKMGAMSEYQAESLHPYTEELTPRLMELEDQLYRAIPEHLREMFEEYVELSVKEASTRANIYFSHGYHAGIKDAPHSAYNERLTHHLQLAEQV